MNKMNEKTRRNIILQLLLLAALIGATFWWLLRDCDVETMLATLRGADPGLIGLGALILVSWHSTGHPRRGLAFGLSLLCFCLAAFTLPIGLLGLMSNF